GNHDFRSWYNLLYGNQHPVADSVSIRNPYRVGLKNVASGTDGHYSWDWDGIHFVNVDLIASDVDPQVPGIPVGSRDPRRALTFLKYDLQTITPGQPVVIMHHYWPDSPTFEYDQSQIDTYASAIAGYNVIAIIHGHAHDTSLGSWNGIPKFNVGSPY